MNIIDTIITLKEPLAFTWDPNKYKSNTQKHGVSFERVEPIWADPYLVVLSAKRRGERRLMAIGEAHACVFSAAFTREGVVIRIISARLASEKERSLYYEQKKRAKAR